MIPAVGAMGPVMAVGVVTALVPRSTKEEIETAGVKAIEPLGTS